MIEIQTAKFSVKKKLQAKASNRMSKVLMRTACVFAGLTAKAKHLWLLLTPAGRHLSLDICWTNANMSASEI